MLYHTRIADGVRIGGFLDSPSQVFVTWKSEDGQKHGELIEAGSGLFHRDLPKGEVVGLDVLPLRKAEKRDSPPKGYPKDKSEYAVPDEYRFPIDGKHIHAAISYFPKHKFKSPAQKRSAAKRILSAAKKHGVHVGDDDAVARAAHGG